MTRYILFFSMAMAGILLLSCDTAQHHEQEGVLALDLSNRDTSVRVQDDLFHFVNGGWIDKAIIPDDKSRWGAFDELRQNNQKILLTLLNEASSARDKQNVEQLKVIDFYRVGMDSLLAEQVAAGVLDSALATIDEIASMKQLQAYLSESALSQAGNFFNFRVLPDFKDSKKNSAFLFVGNVGLPERDYYVNKDKRFVEIRERYLSYIQTMLSLAIGEMSEEDKSFNHDIMALETRLAKAMLTKEDRRDLGKLYNKKSISELNKLVPSIDWEKYFQVLGVQEDSIVVSQPAFMAVCEKIFASGDWKSIRLYLKWNLINQAAGYLHHDLVEKHFEFYQKYLKGVDKMEPRWKRVLNKTNRLLGQVLGQLYVAKTFPEEAKKKTLRMVENIKMAMANRIKNLDWMMDATKEKALAKLSSLTVKIGYPDQWRKYDGMKVGSSSFYHNVIEGLRFDMKRNIAKLGKPVDKKEWTVNPQMVNAYYNPLLNEIVFPAGILQPPFYNYKADAAVNYGGIGVVIGHEVSHGFDDSGSRFDAEGNLNNWWMKEDLEKFKKKGEQLVTQFDAYEPLPGVFVQGKFTLGENIGDLCGVTVAYNALERFLREEGRPEKIDGYTAEQRFFLSFATIWRIKIRDEALITMINTDPHAPPRYRVNATVSNLPSFYKAFDVKEGDSLYRVGKDRVVIW